MQLKKINPLLQEALIENGLTEANEMQQETHQCGHRVISTDGVVEFQTFLPFLHNNAQTCKLRGVVSGFDPCLHYHRLPEAGGVQNRHLPVLGAGCLASAQPSLLSPGDLPH